MKLFEIFSQALEYTWIDKPNIAKFKVGDDTINVVFQKCNLKGFTAISFDRNGDVSVNGRGRAIEIFGTVTEIIKELHKEFPKINFVFEAAMSDSSRVEFYLKFAERLSKQIGFKYDMVDGGYGMVYLIAKTAKQLEKASAVVKDDGLDIE